MIVHLHAIHNKELDHCKINLYRKKFFYVNSHVIHTYNLGWGKSIFSSGWCFVHLDAVDWDPGAKVRASNQRVSLPAKSAKEHAPLCWGRVPQTCDGQVQTLETGIPFLRSFFLGIAV